MITQFKEIGSKKILKELYITGPMPAVKNYVKINGKFYIILNIIFNIDEDMYEVWLRKI